MKTQQINETALEAAVVKRVAEALPAAVHEAVHALLAGAAVPAPEADRAVQNGVRRPKAGGRCDAVWGALDKVSAKGGELPTLQYVLALAEKQGWNANNARIEYYQWRKFNKLGAVVVEHRSVVRRTAKTKVAKRSERRHHPERRLAA